MRPHLEGNLMKKGHISKKDVEHTAWLARIELSEDEKNLFSKQFNEILHYFKKIDSIDTEEVPPTYHILNLVNIFRKDEVQPSLPEKDVLGNASKKEKRFFKAPKIL